MQMQTHAVVHARSSLWWWLQSIPISSVPEKGLYLTNLGACSMPVAHSYQIHLLHGVNSSMVSSWTSLLSLSRESKVTHIGAHSWKR